jgi:hypothetical protein
MEITLFNHKRVNDQGNRFSFAGVVDKGTNTINIGVAKCSKKDSFSKMSGRCISEGRAIKKPIAVIEIQDGNTPFFEFNNAVKDINLSLVK